MTYRIEEAEHRPETFRYKLDQFRLLENWAHQDDDPFAYDDIVVLIRHDGEKGIYVAGGKRFRGGHMPVKEFVEKFQKAFLEKG